MEERDVRECRADDLAEADVHRPDREADGYRHDEERDGEETGAEADTPRLHTGCRYRCSLHAPGGGHQLRFAMRATVRANCTIRGPQREATSSSASTTRWC